MGCCSRIYCFADYPSNTFICFIGKDDNLFGANGERGATVLRRLIFHIQRQSLPVVQQEGAAVHCHFEEIRLTDKVGDKAIDRLVVYRL